MAISTIPEFVSRVLEIRDRWSPNAKYPEIWYRGICDGSLPLLPGAYWRSECDEQSLVLSFRSMVPSFIPREPVDDWEWYYLMQHYGLPTRLLDWTENPLVALFFALSDAPQGTGPTVWVLDPVDLNKRTMIGADAESIVVPIGTGLGELREWLPGNCGKGRSPQVFKESRDFRDNSKPLAIFPKRYNPRIVAQRGVFTVHGCEPVPIEKLMRDTSAGTTARIDKIEIDAAARTRLQDDLWALGTTEAALFPEPQSVAKDLKRSYNVQP